MDKNFSDFDLLKMNDVPCSIENEVRLVPPSATPGYTITSAQSPKVVSCTSNLVTFWVDINI